MLETTDPAVSYAECQNDVHLVRQYYLDAMKTRDRYPPTLSLSSVSTRVHFDEVLDASQECSRQATSSSEDGSTDCEDVGGWVMPESLIVEAVCGAVAACNWSVVMVDPRDQMTTIKMVSEEFEAMTGFTQEEAKGKNWRFLQPEYPTGMDLEELARVRSARMQGIPVTVLLTNRRKSGELFWNLSHLCGLSVAYNSKTGEDLWFLIVSSVDVTDSRGQDELQQHITDLEQIAQVVRQQIAERLAVLPGLMSLRRTHESSIPLDDESFNNSDLFDEPSWRLLTNPCWRHGDQRPTCTAAAKANLTAYFEQKHTRIAASLGVAFGLAGLSLCFLKAQAHRNR